jgi:hypothetical protein
MTFTRGSGNNVDAEHVGDEGDEDVLTQMGSSLADVGADDFVPSDGVRLLAPALQCCVSHATNRPRRRRTRS